MEGDPAARIRRWFSEFGRKRPEVDVGHWIPVGGVLKRARVSSSAAAPEVRARLQQVRGRIRATIVAHDPEDRQRTCSGQGWRPGRS
ncbi:hypothetical protein IVB46_30020 [Bradyrhizobium sp. 61]|nr:hypothetical protein [Bradyrhizobium sp. 61]